MKEDKNDSYLKYEFEFVEDSSSTNSSPYIAYNFHVKLTDALIMFHVCHLYRNCLKLIEKGELTEEEIPNYVNLDYVLMSVREALDNRLKNLSSEYINDNYKYIYDKPILFDICLGYYSNIKKDLEEKIQEAKNKQQIENNSENNG